MISVLINAYACNPQWGSEPGMGWNWIVNIAANCNTYIITEGEWQNEIEEALTRIPYRERLHFFYLPVSDKIRKMCWNQGDWRFYYYYRRWQKRALDLAEKIIKTYNIDVIHQLNMIGFREPGFLWKIKDYAFVWGPIGGTNTFPETYISNFSLKERFFIKLKNKINNYQIRHESRVRKAVSRADILISAIPRTQKVLFEFYQKDSVLMNETGCYLKKENNATDINRFYKTNEFHILWVGRFIVNKQLDLALETISKLKTLPNIIFHIVGDANSSEKRESYRMLSSKLGIEPICVWHGMLPNAEVHKMMQQSQLFFFTSVSEGTSTVVLEALENDLPILCFDTCGFGAIVDDSVGVKIKLTDFEHSINDFAAKITELYHNRALLAEKALNARNKIVSVSWEKKAEVLCQLYEKAILKRSSQ